MRYVSLHTHSTFSYGDGFGTVPEHVSRVAALGMKSLALTEHGNVSSWVQLEKACRTKAIQPIFGLEAYIAPESERRKNHMCLLAMNETGLQNLNRLVTQSFRQFYQFPTIHWKDLVEYNEGIIALSGCSDSELSCILLGGKSFGDKRLEPGVGDMERAVRGVQRYQKVFGDRYYLEVQRFPGLERTCALNPLLAEISSNTGVPLVATSDVHYPYPDQNAMQRILHAAHRGGTVESVDAAWEYDILLTYPQSDEEIFKDLLATGLSGTDALDAILVTEDIAERCTVELPKASTVSFGVRAPKTLLQQWITEGWAYRIQTNQHMQEHIEDYKERVRHEFDTICAREGFVDYFLMVSDLVRWAKTTMNIAVGPGRGSSAGSLVCYLLQITEIDSMQFPMLFERFLDPTRTDPPDIDIDFEDDRVDEVFDYAARKYGTDRVAKIGTFTKYRGRNSLDDISRVYHIPKWKVETIKDKLIERAEGHPRNFKTLEDTYNTFSDIQTLVNETPELSYAARLEGNIRGFGVHPAGLVISSRPLAEITATYQREVAGRQTETIAFDKYDASYLGLLKIDALSLQTMGMVSKVCELAGISLNDLYRIPLNDPATMEAFRTGDVLGIFQFEGITTRRILKKVAPEHIMHLSDVNALSRPGADDKAYIVNKDTGQLPEFVHPIVAQHLSWTYGVVVYEEQILMILRDLGGFAPAELNRMRKIIHDKLGSISFNEYLQRFVKGAAAHGLTEDAAKYLWDGMVSASGYAFNIAHSVSYAHIGYWQMWLKVNYPAEFFTGQLVKCSDDIRRGKLIQEANRHGIKVEPPKLLESQENWTLAKDGTILAGLTSVAGIGPVTAKNIIEWRKGQSHVTWDDLEEVKGIGTKTISKIKDFCESTDPFGINETSRILNRIRSSFSDGELVGVPAPTHLSIDVPKDREFVCYMGIARRKKYYDAVEQLQKRTNTEISYEDALTQLDDPHLLKYVAIEVEDEYGEIVKVRVSRWAYPKYAESIQNLKLNNDVVVAQGFSSDFGGISIQCKKLVVIDPYG